MVLQFWEHDEDILGMYPSFESAEVLVACIMKVLYLDPCRRTFKIRGRYLQTGNKMKNTRIKFSEPPDWLRHSPFLYSQICVRPCGHLDVVRKVLMLIIKF